MAEKQKSRRTVRVIRQVDNYKMDYRLTPERAHQLYMEGKIAYDEVNECYTTQRGMQTGPEVR